MSRGYDRWENDRYAPVRWTALTVVTLMVVIVFSMAAAYAGTKIFRQPTDYDRCLVNGGSFTQNEHGMSCIED